MHLTHGMSKTPEYKIWHDAKSRCFNIKSSNYPMYGRRGITMHDKWRHSFEAFYADMGPRPAGPPRYTLERIDNDGPYSPDNCRWATYAEQLRNTRRNRLITHNGRTQCLRDWADELGLKFSTLKHRIDSGLSVDKALTAPTYSMQGPRKKDSRLF